MVSVSTFERSDIISTYAAFAAARVEGGHDIRNARDTFIEQRGNMITVTAESSRRSGQGKARRRPHDERTCTTDQLSLFVSTHMPEGLRPTVASHLHGAFGSEAHTIATMTGADTLLDPEHPTHRS